MQNRYAGDIGDYAKYSLLRALSFGLKLGVAWYLFPDEEEKRDGRHTDYLCDEKKWRDFDRETFDKLYMIVKSGNRSVRAVESSDLLADAVFSGRRLDFHGCKLHEQEAWRKKWFRKTRRDLEDCDLVFADPDNGLIERESFRPGRRRHGKGIPECEIAALLEGERPVILYHHNSRRKGGHAQEVCHWQRRLEERLGSRTCAVRWRYISPRTFFIVNCGGVLERRARQWCSRWTDKDKVFFVDSPGIAEEPADLKQETTAICRGAPFEPDWASPPGDTILDLLEQLCWTREELARRLCCSVERTDRLIEGNAVLTADDARQLSSVLGSSMEFWLTREEHYRKDLSRLAASDRFVGTTQ